MSEVLPYRVEQTLEPPSLVVTLSARRTKRISFAMIRLIPLVRLVRWRQISPDACQLVIEPKFKKWWGFDVRYEGSTLVIEVRKPWTEDTIRGMVIAVDPGHGGSDNGALGPHGTLEKEANLEIAQARQGPAGKSRRQTLSDADAAMWTCPLYDRPRIAWKNKARLFVSVHCNASGLGENPLVDNGNSVYWYQPQSQALAEAIHAGYRKTVPALPDRGLYYADFAVCRMTQMPAVLTEQAYIILPEQEDLLFDPAFQKNLAAAIVSGIKAVRCPPMKILFLLSCLEPAGSETYCVVSGRSLARPTRGLLDLRPAAQRADLSGHADQRKSDPRPGSSIPGAWRPLSASIRSRSFILTPAAPTGWRRRRRDGPASRTSRRSISRSRCISSRSCFPASATRPSRSMR